MEKCLFMGNGINRCGISSISWEDLLDEIATEYNVLPNKNISFPMQFENIANQILSLSDFPSDDIYIELKEKIISKLKTAALPKHSPHASLASVADSIITTNYDFLIEKSLDSSFEIDKIPRKSNIPNNKYNINNSTNVLEKEIYHIHGDIRQAKSICLGYEHYAGTLQRLRESVTTKNKNNGNIPEIICYLQEPKYELNTWATKFFTDNIHIVGLGLTQSEIDLWWIITYRAFLFYSNRFNARKLINNKIVYHDIAIQPDENMRYALENCNVEYCFHEIPRKENEYFYQEYMKISLDIQK